MRCAVLGDPVSHSLSPVLHRAGYAAHGLAWEYDTQLVASGELGEFLAGLDDSWRGLSLTMPLKREAMTLADRVSDTARAARAANTLVLVEGEVHGDNTDVPGAAAAVRERFDGPIGTVTILGGGATAAATGLALAGLGARSFRLLVRSPERAAETASVIAAHGSGPNVEVGSLADDPAAGDLVVSTIPAAAQDEELIARCADVPVVFEVVYDAWPTPLAASAADRVLVSGLDLLVHQAALQFFEFTGLVAPLAAMRVAGETALAARQVGT
jgi:shikimate dehydrogenase